MSQVLDPWEINKRIYEALGLNTKTHQITKVVITCKHDEFPQVEVERTLIYANEVDALAMCFEEIPKEIKDV